MIKAQSAEKWPYIKQGCDGYKVWEKEVRDKSPFNQKTIHIVEREKSTKEEKKQLKLTL